MVVEPDGIALQHRRLSEFVEEVERALERKDRRRCETATFRLQGAVNAHFDVEAQVVFPSLRNRRPDLAGALAALEGEHRQLRRLLDALATCVFASDAETVWAMLSDFRDRLARHERGEESLLASAEESATRLLGPGSLPSRRHDRDHR